MTVRIENAAIPKADLHLPDPLIDFFCFNSEPLPVVKSTGTNSHLT